VAFNADQLRKAIAKQIVKYPTRLVFLDELVGGGAEGIKIVMETLRAHPALTTLELNSLTGAEEDKALAESLETNKTVTTLRLNGTRLGAEGSKRLANVLKTNSTLTTIVFRYNNPGDDGGKALAEALKTNKTLTTLDLDYNNLGAEVGEALAQALETNSTLTSLNLEFNTLGAVGIQALTRALNTNKTLTSLDLSWNKLDAAGIQPLIETIRTNKNRTLKYLSLALNKLGDAGGKSLAQALTTNSTLTLLNLMGCNLGAGGIQAIANALKTNRTLSSLYISDLGIEEFKAFVEALETNTTLNTLNHGYSNKRAGVDMPQETELAARCETLLARNRALQEKDKQNWAKISIMANAVASNPLGDAALELIPEIFKLAGFNTPAVSAPDTTSDKDRKTAVDKGKKPADDKDKKSSGDADKKNTGELDKKSSIDADKQSAAADADSKPNPLQPAFNVGKFRQSKFFEHVVGELHEFHKSGGGPASKLPSSEASALADGNCAFNVMVLGVLDLILDNQIADQSLYNTLGESLKIAADQASFLAWYAGKSSPELQRTLAPVFRKLAIEHIEKHYPQYQESYQAALQAAFNQYKLNGEQDESFCTHPFILSKFIELKQLASAKDSKTTDEDQRQLLINWWNNEGKKHYFDTLKQPAKSAGQLESWGGDVEISALANVFKLNIQAKKYQQTQMLGVGYGIVEKLSADDIAQLEALRIGTRTHAGFRIEQTGDQLKYLLNHPGLSSDEIKLLDEASKRSLLAFKNASHTPLPSHLVALHTKLEQIGAFSTADGKTFRFINDTALSQLLKPVSEALKTQVMNAHRSNPPGFQIEHAKNHWSYQRVPRPQGLKP